MTEAVVDELEIVEIDEDDGGKIAVAPCIGDGLLEPVDQEVAVGQPGQRIVSRLVFKLGLVLTTLGDVSTVPS